MSCPALPGCCCSHSIEWQVNSGFRTALLWGVSSQYRMKGKKRGRGKDIKEIYLQWPNTASESLFLLIIQWMENSWLLLLKVWLQCCFGIYNVEAGCSTLASFWGEVLQFFLILCGVSFCPECSRFMQLSDSSLEKQTAPRSQGQLFWLCPGQQASLLPSAQQVAQEAFRDVPALFLAITLKERKLALQTLPYISFFFKTI